LNTSTFFLRHLKAKGKLLFFPKSLIKDQIFKLQITELVSGTLSAIFGITTIAISSSDYRAFSPLSYASSGIWCGMIVSPFETMKTCNLRAMNYFTFCKCRINSLQVWQFNNTQALLLRKKIILNWTGKSLFFQVIVAGILGLVSGKRPEVCPVELFM